MGLSLARLPLLDRLAPSRRVLLAGAGGGFDLLAGLPLHAHLRAEGKEVFLASLSFSELKRASGTWLGSVLEVLPEAGGDPNYFPERYLSEWFASRGERVPVYCFKPAGARAVLQVYEDLVRTLEVDALVLVDGGTDSLMRGDEPSLGTPAEDGVSLAAADMLDLPVKLLVNLGFGVDTAHGVCHAYVLEAVADLTASGHFLGAFSLLPGMPEFQAFSEAVAWVCERMPGKESIVCTSVVASGEGRFGDHHPTARTEGSRLFLNPLMAMYWAFEVEGVARRCLYLDWVKDTWSRWDVHRTLHNYLSTVTPRDWRDIPL